MSRGPEGLDFRCNASDSHRQRELTTPDGLHPMGVPARGPSLRTSNTARRVPRKSTQGIVLVSGGLGWRPPLHTALTTAPSITTPAPDSRSCPLVMALGSPRSASLTWSNPQSPTWGRIDTGPGTPTWTSLGAVTPCAPGSGKLSARHLLSASAPLL